MGGGHLHPHPRQRLRAHREILEAHPGRGRRVTRTRQRSCVMALPRLRRTSTSLAVWIMASPRMPLTAWISPLETGSPARRCHSVVKRLPARSWNRPASSIARTVLTPTPSQPTTSQPTLGRHWLPIRLLTITTAPRRVLSMARCLSWAASSSAARRPRSMCMT